MGTGTQYTSLSTDEAIGRKMLCLEAQHQVAPGGIRTHDGSDAEDLPRQQPTVSQLHRRVLELQIDLMEDAIPSSMAGLDRLVDAMFADYGQQ